MIIFSDRTCSVFRNLRQKSFVSGDVRTLDYPETILGLIPFEALLSPEPGRGKGDSLHMIHSNLSQTIRGLRTDLTGTRVVTLLTSSWKQPHLFTLLVGISLFCSIPGTAWCQVGDQAASEEQENEKIPPLKEGEKPPSLLIEIADTPRTIDPATLIPGPLAKVATVRFEKKPLRDIVKWLQDEQSITTLIDSPALAEEGLLLGEPITDHLDKAPIYLLLNRLGIMGLGWYYEDETLVITTKTNAEEHYSTIPYNLGDLIDAGYRAVKVIETIRHTIESRWDDDDGQGGASVLLGDVVFIRQTDAVHYQVAGLLAALRQHGRRTFSFDPPQHEVFRQKLAEKVTIDFDETPLMTAINVLAGQVEADIRLDLRHLNDEGISERTPVTLRMTERPLDSVLRALLVKIQLTWSFRDGVMWITTRSKASEIKKTAVFDVRDLCRNSKESAGLANAVRAQTQARWEDDDGEGGAMTSPKPGVLVVLQEERILEDLSKLLESYRTALRNSKVRKGDEPDPKEVVTRYYRMEKEIAKDLEKLLPELVEPGSWKSPAHPDATGTIRSAASKSELLSSNKPSDAPVIANSVLIVRQTREIHTQIAEVIKKIQFGDAVSHPTIGGMGMGGMGGGMGGGGMGGMGGGSFGGGFFSVNPKSNDRK